MFATLRQSAFVKGILGGLLGMFVALVLGVSAWHLWVDHQALHTIITMINQNAAAQQRPPSPEKP